LVAFLATFKRPDLVLGVFSEDMTPAFWENPRMWQLPFMKMLLAWGAVVREFSTEGRDREWMEQHLAEVEFGDTSTVGELVGPGAVVQWANEATNCDPAVLLVENLVEIGDPTAAEMMASVSGPFHVAYGDVETGGTVEPYEIELLRTHAQRPSATRFPGQSHMIHLTDPDGMVGDLDQWLTTNQF
jgi:pimeloyl-ACP methyl ester carboxylesterase